jgi:hypothetical protein
MNEIKNEAAVASRGLLYKLIGEQLAPRLVPCIDSNKIKDSSKFLS